MPLYRKALGLLSGVYAPAFSLDPQTNTGGVRCEKPGTYVLCYGALPLRRASKAVSLFSPLRFLSFLKRVRESRDEANRAAALKSVFAARANFVWRDYLYLFKLIYEFSKYHREGLFDMLG